MSDDHPFIIKMQEIEPEPQHGLGYEIFHGMKQHQKNVAQYVEATGESDTYEELLNRCTRMAINLKKEVPDEHDIVGLCVSNHIHACVPYAGALFISRKVVALDSVIVPEEKAIMLQKVTPRIIFVDEQFLSNIEQSIQIAKLNIKVVIIGGKTKQHQSYTDFLVASEEDVKSFQPSNPKSLHDAAVIFFSSGTSGLPKGICISHYALLARTDGAFTTVSVVFSELNWISYALFVFRAFRTGTARVLMDEFNITKVWRAIEKFKIDMLFASIFQIAEFAKTPKPNDVDISSLKILISGGSALPPEVFLNIKKLLPNVITVQGYGLTEICGIALVFDLSRPDHREWQIKKPDSCGTPIPGIWYKIVDPDTEEILGPNKPGELRMKSKLTMVGYHNMDSSGAFDSEGWLKTGDILQYDEDHCFFVIDRIKEMIKYRSWVISPSVVELVLMSHPAVDKVAVIGIPHAEDSDYPMGIVTLRANTTADPKELEKYVEERVTDRQRLRDGVKIIEEMPMTSTGKVQKRILRRMVLDGKL